MAKRNLQQTDITELISSGMSTKKQRALLKKAISSGEISAIEAMGLFLNEAGGKRFPTPRFLEEAVAKEVPGFELFANEQEDILRRERMLPFEEMEKQGSLSVRGKASLEAMRAAQDEPPLSKKGREDLRLEMEERDRLVRKADRRSTSAGIKYDGPGRNDELGVGRLGPNQNQFRTPREDVGLRLNRLRADATIQFEEGTGRRAQTVIVKPDKSGKGLTVEMQDYRGNPKRITKENSNRIMLKYFRALYKKTGNPDFNPDKRGGIASSIEKRAAIFRNQGKPLSFGATGTPEQGAVRRNTLVDVAESRTGLGLTDKGRASETLPNEKLRAEIKENFSSDPEIRRGQMLRRAKLKGEIANPTPQVFSASTGKPATSKDFDRLRKSAGPDSDISKLRTQFMKMAKRGGPAALIALALLVGGGALVGSTSEAA